MVRLFSLWMIFLGCFVPFYGNADLLNSQLMNNQVTLNDWDSSNAGIGQKKQKEKLQSDVLAKIEVLDRKDARNFMKTFNLGELKVVPYTPEGIKSYTARSQADLSFKLPQYCGSIKVKTGLCYHLANNSKSAVGSQEQVLYLVSTKTLNGSRWKPFLSLSYMRSQVKGTPEAFIIGLKELQNLSSIDYSGSSYSPHLSAHYQNVAVLETCCGLQPMKNLSLILSFNYLKPVDKKVHRLNTKTSKKFDDVKLRSQSQGVDLRLEYKVRKGLNLLVKSECLLTNGILRDKDAKPVLIEGQLIVSF